MMFFQNIRHCRTNCHILVIVNWYGARQLRTRIKSNEYDRLPKNTKNKLIRIEQSYVVDFVKNPIQIKNNRNKELVSEKILQKLILEYISSFLYSY